MSHGCINETNMTNDQYNRLNACRMQQRNMLAFMNEIMQQYQKQMLTSRTETSKVPPPKSKTRIVSLLFFSKP